jgi:hypothetical protein
MKAKWFLRTLAVVLAAASFSSCSKEPGSETPKAEFPEKSSIEVNAGDRNILYFNANRDWEIQVTGGQWFHIVDDNTATSGVRDKRGDAGQNIQIRYYISDAAIDFDASTAVIELTMDGKTEEIFTITRAGEVRWVRMYISTNMGDFEIKEDFVLDYTYNKRPPEESYTVSFLANFNWDIDIPEGLMPSVELLGGEANKTSAKVTYQWKPTSISEPFEGNIVLSDDSGETFEFPVKYSGMGETDRWFTPSNFGNSYPDKAFNAAAYYLIPGSDATPTEKSISGRVYTAGMEYDINVFMYVPDDTSTPGVNELASADLNGKPESAWLHIVDNEGMITISVDENTGEAREAWVDITPKGLVKPDWNDKTAVNNFVKANATSFKVTQRAVVIPVVSGFYVKWDGMSNTSVVSNNDLISGKNSQMLLDLVAAYNVPADNTYMYIVPDPKWVDSNEELYFTNGGDLFISPLLLTAGSDVYCKAAPIEGSGGWTDSPAVTLSSMSKDGHPGVRVSNLNRVTSGDMGKIGVLLFYDSQEALDNGGDAIAAFILQVEM